MTAGELLVKLGFEVDTLKLNEFIKDLGELNLSSVIAATGLKGIVDGLTDIMKTADGVAGSLNKLSTITGIQQGVFQQWDNAAQQFNVTAGVTSSTISDIQKHIAMIPTGDPWAIRLAQLFNIRNIQGKDPAEVLQEVLQHMEGMDVLQKRRLMGMAGLNEELLQLVGHEDQISQQVKNQQGDWQKLQDNLSAIRKLTYDWQVFIVGIGAALAPIITPFIELLDNLTDFIIQIEQAMPEWLKDLTSAIVLWGVLYNTIRAVVLLLTGLSAVKFLAPLLGGLATVATKMNPYLAIGTAGLAGGAMLYDFLKPKDQTSNVTNGGDFNQTNNYSVNGNDPKDMTYRIQELHKSQMRDAAAQNPQVNW